MRNEQVRTFRLKTLSLDRGSRSSPTPRRGVAQS